MKVVSNGYKNQIKEMGREIDSIITYYNHYKMITENSRYILTEDGVKINTEQINNDNSVEITAEDIYSVKVITHGALLKTMMKELDFEVKQEMKIGSIVNYKFGLKVNGEYEYVDYGNFIIQQKEYNEDNQTYTYIAYDMMLKSMIPYKSTTPYPSTLYDVLKDVLSYSLISTNLEEFPNSERQINENPFENMNITCRDVLDFITEVTGCSSFIRNDEFVIEAPNETNLELDDNSFKDTNVKFNKIFGPINSVLFSRGDDTDIIEIKDDASIEQNGVTQIKIKDNPLLQNNDRSDYFEELFEMINGLTYTINELSSTGVTYLEFNDKYNVHIKDNIYPCLLLNDEIIVEQGLEENIFTEELEESEKEYKTSKLDDRGQKWANIQVKKDIGEITLEVGQLNEEVDGKVGNNEIISKINLSPESATIQSQKIDLQGYVTVSDLAGTGTTTINGSNITTGTISANRVSGGTLEGSNIKCGNNFSVDTTGKVTSKDIDITGGSIVLTRNATGQGIPFTIEQTAGGHTYKVQIGAGAFTYYRDGTSLGYFSAGASNYSHMSLTNAGTRTIYLNGNSGNITCNAVNPSLEEKKKNIEKFDENALEILKDVDIYKYNYKYEDDKTKKRIGFVIGDKYKYRKEITSAENDGADLYSMVSVLWQAVKEQQDQIQELKNQIDKLKGGK